MTNFGFLSILTSKKANGEARKISTRYEQVSRLNELNLESISHNGLNLTVYWFHAVRSNAPYNRKRHAHPCCEMHLMLEGENEIVFRDQSIVIHPGEGLYIPPRLEHQLVSRGNNHFFKFSICFSADADPNIPEAVYFEHAYQSGEPKVFKISRELRSALDICLKEAVQRDTGFLMRIQFNVLDSLILLARILYPHPELQYDIQTRKLIDDERYQMIEHYIQENMNRWVRSNEISQYIRLSEKQVNRIVRACADYATVTDMIVCMKINEAKKLLANPQLRSNDIAIRLGFSSEYYFNRMFKKTEGLPPGRYRKSLCAR